MNDIERKENELNQQKMDVNQPLRLLEKNKHKIDDEIKSKVHETEQLRDEYRKRARERLQAEKRARLEREKLELNDKQADKQMKMKQIKETEGVENKALDLHRKEKQLKQQK